MGGRRVKMGAKWSDRNLFFRASPGFTPFPPASFQHELATFWTCARAYLLLIILWENLGIESIYGPICIWNIWIFFLASACSSDLLARQCLMDTIIGLYQHSSTLCSHQGLSVSTQHAFSQRVCVFVLFCIKSHHTQSCFTFCCNCLWSDCNTSLARRWQHTLNSWCVCD